MVKSLILALILMSSTGYAQEQMGLVIRPNKTLYRTPGLLSASATYSPGIMLNREQTNYNLHVFAEYHINRKVSVKSDSYLFLNSPNTEIQDFNMFRSYFGMFYHLNAAPFGNWDVKLGFLPGITYSERTDGSGTETKYTNSLTPSFSTAIGFDYYVWKYFHFFTQVSYTHATLRNLPNGSEKIDELLFSVGLGFQIPTLR